MNNSPFPEKPRPHNSVGSKKWGIVSAILFLPMLLTAALATFFVLILLNGYPSLPDAMVGGYLVGALALVFAFSLAAGWLAKKLSGALSLPLWLAGLISGGVFWVLLPISLFVLTFALLALFGLL